MRTRFKIFFTCLITVFILLGFSVPVNMVGNWTQQFLPSGLPNFQLSDIYFLDSLTGFAVTGNGSPNDSSGYILKTINGGENWELKFAEYRDFSRVKFINNNTGFVSGGYFNGARLYKTTNGGDNWSPLNIPGGGQIYFDDMSVLNENIIWLVASNSLVGGVFYTSNGGTSWTPQLTLGSDNPNHVYFYNSRIGFIAEDNFYLRRTENSGLNWIIIPGQNGFTEMYFVDSLTGWKASGSMKKTIDGGFNWINQTLPSAGGLASISTFSVIGRDTIWGGDGYIIFPNSEFRGILYRTTNGGNNWYYQIPDTAIHSGRYKHVQFVDKNKGWAYWSSSGIHTTNGGDTTFLGLKQISSEIPKEFKLYQNYPNPFNPKTNIKYQIINNKHKSSSTVKLTVYDVTGREVLTLVNEEQNAGTYEVDFSGNGYSSGVYFYSLIVNGIKIDTRKMILLK